MALPPIPSLMPARDFNALSLADLLEAREAAHVHLARKEGVIATAVGRYLIRQSDPNSQNPYSVYQGDKKDLGPRRLDNSVITKWSWPCVLVFVRSWRDASEFRRDPQNFVSPSIDLPDGREIPVCVVEAAADVTASAPMSPTVDATSGCYSGGLPVFSEVQGSERFGTLGCLVTDGVTTYALTAAHVAGPPNAVSQAARNGEINVIGTASENRVARQPFEKIYPTLSGKYVDSCLDAGLIRLNSIQRWSAAVHGIGAVGELMSIDMNTLSLSLIATPVLAHGAASGTIAGQILALFFRYQALGGYDYVADLLVGPRPGEGPLRTRAGDSGAIFFHDHIKASADAEAAKVLSSSRGNKDREKLEKQAAEAFEKVVAAYKELDETGAAPPWRPLALQWGGQRFFGAPAAGGGLSFPFALATSLSTICRELSVEIIRGHNIALPEYWGEVGHFTIGEVACGLISSSSTTLTKLFLNNRKNIGFDDATITSGHVTGLGPNDFVPLANVPDDVWKKGGVGVRRAKDNPTHYADMDEKGADGKTLFEKCLNAANIKPQVWRTHYESINVSENHQGSVPFRVKQIFEAMVQYVSQGKVTEFVCAAGILAHYVGDACHPLHSSRLANENGVHTPYETTMLNRNRGTNGVIQMIRTGVGGRVGASDIATGAAAAKRTITLMRTVQTILPPEVIVQVWSDVGGPDSPDYSKMWQKLGDKTGKCMAEGALLLASLWQSAWKVGNGDQNIQSTATIDYSKFRALFEPNGTPGHGTQFLPSLYLSEY